MGKERRITQREKVLMFLRDEGSITPLDALREFGIMRLAARIWELRKLGFSIEKNMESSRGRYGDEVRYARYKLA